MVAFNFIGLTFNRLTVIARAPSGRKGWLCRCACGREKVVNSTHLRKGSTKSCGCYASDRMRARNTTHGGTGTPEHRAWQAAKNRCFVATCHAFGDYGGRGITMCERWRDDFAAFLADMGPRPSPRHTLDRRDNVRHSFRGQSATAPEIARSAGLSAHLVDERIRRGWAPEQAATLPPNRSRRVAHG